MNAKIDGGSATETRQEILRVSLSLFAQKGYAGTTVRDIAAALRLAPSALYYHFANKDDIVRTLLVARIAEVDELIAWVSAQTEKRGLLRAAALKWIDRSTPERLIGMQLAQANPELMGKLNGTGADIRKSTEVLLDLLTDAGTSPQNRLFVRLVFNTMNATLLATRGTKATHEDVIAVARRAVMKLTSEEM